VKVTDATDDDLFLHKYDYIMVQLVIPGNIAMANRSLHTVHVVLSLTRSLT
jgi:hypothetical protein